MSQTVAIDPHENRTLGIILMLGAFLAYTGIDAQSKVMAEIGYHAIFITWGRLVAQLVLMVPYMIQTGLPGLKSRRLDLQIARGLCMLVAGVLFVMGLGHLPLATMTAINFVSPFIITILAMIVLKEAVGIHRWLAIVIGFTGAMIVIRPGTEAFSVASLYGLGAALFWATSIIVTRVVQRYDSSMLTIFYTIIVGIGGSSFLVIEYWKEVNLLAMVFLFGMAVCSTVGQLLMNGALKQTSPAVLAPLNYSQLLWAGLVGAIVFSEFPDRWTWVGAGVIVISGLYVWHRERQPAAPKPRPAE
ncbi:MAG: DMT family transporter [Alphaproteobacteria bacterium]